MITVFAESIKRLYKNYPDKVTDEKIDELLSNNKITQEEYEYIKEIKE